MIESVVVGFSQVYIIWPSNGRQMFLPYILKSVQIFNLHTRLTKYNKKKKTKILSAKILPTMKLSHVSSMKTKKKDFTRSILKSHTIDSPNK